MNTQCGFKELEIVMREMPAVSSNSPNERRVKLIDAH